MSPFEHLKIQRVHTILKPIQDDANNTIIKTEETQDFLVNVMERVPCPNCHSSQRPYCTRCGIPLGHIPPRIHLPVNLVIFRQAAHFYLTFRHPQEKHGKSTSTHAKLIAPDQTSIIIHNMRDGVPDEFSNGTLNASRSLLLFPSEDAVNLQELDPDSFDTLVVVDGTWSQAKMMTRMMKDAGMRHVKIEKHSTLFWRYQNFGDDYLATIEAIYYFFKSYCESFEQPNQVYDGKYDNLLYYFAMQYDFIQHYYNHHTQRTFHSKKKQGYIKYSRD